ncbi:hypothetical protein MK805_04760 [Shimazuella sp. AN120528]|uniref:hypothetical protein n=1 Tax=Shimazuella soli TaxID=1892854 RepID=UPI001F0FBA71|nr:hypothetical protein [Shimazuella soli]MCH5584279.1 hypothetical protein [Shimazuella soli]
MMETLASLQQTKAIHLNKLWKLDVLQTFLTEITSILKVPSSLVAASQFSKRYSSYLFSLSLNQLLTSGKFPLIQRDRDFIEFNYQTGELELIIQESTVKYQAKHCSKIQMDRYIQHYFAEHLVPLWSSISQLTGIKMDLLWENTFIYIAWTCLNKTKTPDSYDNFIYLTREADGSLFHLSENPFTAFHAGAVRNKCCLYFMMPGASGVKCKNCPLDCKK